MTAAPADLDLAALADAIPQWGAELGLDRVAITDTDLGAYSPRLRQWLDNQYHGEMDWMASHGAKRSEPGLLEPGTVRVISARMNYLPPDTAPVRVLHQPERAYIARYALGRDYHKLLRARLAKLAKKIQQAVAGDLPRAFVDSAPVMEKPLAEKAGLGWIGKHTLVLSADAGSWFFLGELFTNLALPVTGQPVADQCGSCQACLKVCPTDAFPAPYQLDARRCISYLTIEHKGAIPEPLRPLLGNRVFGCDDCQLVCPWNRYAKPTAEDDFRPRHGLDHAALATLFNWDETTFLERTAGSPIRRVGFSRWRRNLAVALGNAPTTEAVLAALTAAKDDPSALVREHVHWALAQHPKTSVPPPRLKRGSQQE